LSLNWWRRSDVPPSNVGQWKSKKKRSKTTQRNI